MKEKNFKLGQLLGQLDGLCSDGGFAVPTVKQPLVQRERKAAEHSRSAAPRRGFKNRLLMNVPRPGLQQNCTSELRAELKNAAPSKKPNRCCGADTAT
jgi:hypothetical protein